MSLVNNTPQPSLRGAAATKQSHYAKLDCRVALQAILLAMTTRGKKYIIHQALLLQVLPERLAEILFPVIYITELVSGEVTGRFEKLRSTDKFLGPYFQSKEIS